MSAIPIGQYLSTWFTSRNGYRPDVDSKTWEPVFSKDRSLKENSPDFDGLLKMHNNADGDDFSIFWQGTPDPEYFYEVGEVEEFCRGTHQDDLESTTGTEKLQRRAWLDDRSFPHKTGSGCVRKYPNPLTAAELRKHLKIPRFGDKYIPNADRRLIYIADLDPHYIRALTETATFHQAAFLKGAIWKYLARQTSIRVNIPSMGFLVYELELHLPYFALATSPTSKDHHLRGENSMPQRKWIDLSFLKISAPGRQHSEKDGLCEAQISFVICGPDDGQWVAYAFVDTKFDDNDLEDEDFLYEGFQPDPIASNGEVDANFPIRNPRLYFLKVWKIRMVQIIKEWQQIVRTVECSIKEYIDRHSSTLSRHSGAIGDRTEDLRETFDWTMRAIGLLRQLLPGLSETTKAWERFASGNGDINYFDNIKSSPDNISPHRLLRAIRGGFETLEDLQQKLLDLEKTCQRTAQALELRLILESNHAAQRNGLTSGFTFSVRRHECHFLSNADIFQIVTPFVLACSLFSLPQPIIHFKLNAKSFVAVVVVIMVVLKLLFLLQDAFLHRSRWWKKATQCKVTMQLDEVAYCQPISEYCSMFVRRIRRNHIDRSTAGLEMEV